MAPYPSLFLLLLPLVSFLWFILKNINKQGNKPSHPPCPPKLPIIGNLHKLGDLPHRSLQKLSEQYGPIMLLQLGFRPTLVVSSAKIAKEVLKTHDLDFCNRPSLVAGKRFSYGCQDITFAPYGDYWREVRKICVLELFSSKRVQSFSRVREEEVGDLMKSLFDSASKPLDLTAKLFTLTKHIVCRVAFGKSYQSRHFNEENFCEIIYEFRKLFGCFMAADYFPYFGWIIDVLSGRAKRLDSCFHALDDFYQQIVDEHRDPLRMKPEQEDIVDILLRLQRDQTFTITDNNIRGILTDLFLAGVETSSLTMGWAMTELARKPELMKKVQAEIRECVGKKGKVEEGDLDQLHYLKLVVKETLRLHLLTVFLLPRECVNHCKIDGYDIYPKTRVLVNAWAIARSNEYWDNPDEFIPERFLNSSIDYKGLDFEFLPFGSGRRMCPALGMGVANVECALANLLYGFDWELPPGVKKEDISTEEMFALNVHRKYPLHLVPVKTLFYSN